LVIRRAEKLWEMVEEKLRVCSLREEERDGGRDAVAVEGREAVEGRGV